MGLKQVRLFRYQHLAKHRLRSAGQAADANAIGACFVCVPADPDPVFLRIGGDAGVPVVGLADANAHRFVPALTIRAPRENIRLAVPESLPDEPGPAAA